MHASLSLNASAPSFSTPPHNSATTIDPKEALYLANSDISMIFRNHAVVFFLGGFVANRRASAGFVKPATILLSAKMDTRSSMARRRQPRATTNAKGLAATAASKTMIATASRARCAPTIGSSAAPPTSAGLKRKERARMHRFPLS